MRERKLPGLLATGAILALAWGGQTAAPARGAGVLLATIPMNMPVQIAVDSRVGRVFVSDMGPLNKQGQPTGQGSIHVLDGRTGALLHTISTGQPAWPMLMDERAGRLFIAVSNKTDSRGRLITPGRIMALDTHSGAVVATVATGEDIAEMLVDPERSRVFVASRGDFNSRTPGSLITLDASTGAVVRKTVLGHDPQRLLLDRRTGHVFVTYQDIVERYYWLEKTTLYMLDARTGRVLRASPLALPGYVASAAVDEQTGRAFLLLTGRLASTMVMVETGTGVVLRTTPTGGRALSLGVDERAGRLFVVNIRQDAHEYFSESDLKTFDARTGTLLRTVDLRRAVVDRMIVDTPARRVFLLSSGVQNRYEHLDYKQASLKVLDVTSGMLVRALAGLYDDNALVDERTGHLIITRLGGRDTTGRPLGASQIVALDGRSGQGLQGWLAGRFPGPMVLNEAAGRLYAIDRGPLDVAGRVAGRGMVLIFKAQP